METMKAASYTGVEKIEIREVERLAPPPGHVSLATRQVGICGSDLHNYFGNWPTASEFALGHETCGVIAEVGSGVTGFEVGDHVVVECFSHCSRCVYCLKGDYNHCVDRRWISTQQHGGFAEYSNAHSTGLFKLPKDMSFEDGALVEPLAVAVRAVERATAGPRDRMAILGGGTIGQLCLAVAKAQGVGETLITVKYPQQAKMAKDFGADHVIDISRADAREFIDDFTDGTGMDAIIETVGGADNFNLSLATIRNRGIIILVAGYHKPLTVDLARAVWSEAIITGSNCYAYSGMKTDFQIAIDLLASGKVRANRIVTHRFPFTDIAQAFEISADKESGSVKVHLQQPGG